MSADDDDLMDLPQESAEGELPTWTLAPLHLQKVYKIMNPRTKIPLFWSQMLHQVKNPKKTRPRASGVIFMILNTFCTLSHPSLEAAHFV